MTRTRWKRAALLALLVVAALFALAAVAPVAAQARPGVPSPCAYEPWNCGTWSGWVRHVKCIVLGRCAS